MTEIGFHAMPPSTTEYRLVIIRPSNHADGRPEYYYSKRDMEHARKGLVDHYANEARIAKAVEDGLAAGEYSYSHWNARIDTRTISDWKETA